MQIWIYAALGIAGFTMGCVFKFPAVILVSAAIVVFVGALAASQGWPAVSALVAIVSALLTLHVAYLMGLFASLALLTEPQSNSEDDT